MVQTTLLNKEYTLRLTMGAVSTFVALTSKQPDYVFQLLGKISEEGYEPSAEDMLYVSAFVFACLDSAKKAEGEEPISFDTFSNTADYTEVLQAFISVVVNEAEKHEKKSSFTQNATLTSTKARSTKKK